MDFSKLVDQLETGEIDLLVSKVASPKSLPHQPSLEEDFMMAQRKDHPRPPPLPERRLLFRKNQWLRGAPQSTILAIDRASYSPLGSLDRLMPSEFEEL